NTYAAVIKFNKSNEKYRITVRDYSEDIDYGSENGYQDAITRMNNDILTGNAPDLISLGNVNVKLMAQKGVFEDLGKYLDGSGQLKREDLVQSVLQAYTINDTLCAIPTTFSIATLMSASSLVGDEMGWTVDEMLEVVAKMPEDAVIMEYPTKERVLTYMLSYGADDYINWTERKCYFDSEDFIKILEFANSFPADYSRDEDSPVMPELVEAGRLLLVDQSISRLSDYQIIHTIWGEPITCIGYPTAGSNGSVLNGNSAIAISSKSKYKDAAWEFLEGFLLDSAENDRFSWGFSVIESKLQAQFEEEMTPDYAMDENGEIMKDENGDPIEYSHSGWSFGNNVSYDLYSATQDEADAVRKLIDNTTTLISRDTQTMSIITEEVAPYFEGQKSVQEVADIIQNRIQTYVDEIS
ncbi:MAG: extracellular solute-binding protein, partial [Lachnospiraceae bacterium]|nr:extracellular solute-binding protein [Lachnospiraceae bacterium]